MEKRPNSTTTILRYEVETSNFYRLLRKLSNLYTSFSIHIHLHKTTQAHLSLFLHRSAKNMMFFFLYQKTIVVELGLFSIDTLNCYRRQSSVHILQVYSTIKLSCYFHSTQNWIHSTQSQSKSKSNLKHVARFLSSDFTIHSITPNCPLISSKVVTHLVWASRKLSPSL